MRSTFSKTPKVFVKYADNYEVSKMKFILQVELNNSQVRKDFLMGNNTISQKIDAYAQANLKALKQEEAKTGRKMTKFDIAQYMLQHGKLNKNEYANWMNTTEGFNAQAMTQQQKTALKQGSVWGFAGYGGGQESYLDSMTSFSQKTPVEKQNAISGHQMKLNETVAERKKKAAEINNHLKNEKILKKIDFGDKLAKLKDKAIKDMISDADFVEKLTILILEQKVNNEYHLLKYIMENYSSSCTPAERTELLHMIVKEQQRFIKMTKEDMNKDVLELTKEIETLEKEKKEKEETEKKKNEPDLITRLIYAYKKHEEEMERMKAQPEVTIEDNSTIEL